MAEILAQQWLKDGNVRRPPVPTTLISLADLSSSIEVRKVPLKNYHGAVWHMRSGWVIHLREEDTPEEQRFTLFHEAFHILVRCKSTPAFSKGEDSLGSFKEMISDVFTLCMIMPEEWVEDEWAKVQDIDIMATIFGVPRRVMHTRLGLLGLLP